MSKEIKFADGLEIGERIKLSTTFLTDPYDPLSVADPTAVTFYHRDPDGGITTYVYGIDTELVRESEGVYSVELVPINDGRHYTRFMSDTAFGGAKERWFTVEKSVFFA